MQVLVAAHDCYPDPESGGTGRYVYETARRLVERGHDVAVVTRRRGDVPPRGRVDGVDVHRYDLAVANRSGPAVLAAVPSAARRVAGVVDDVDPDVASFQGPVTALLVDRALDDAVPRRCTFHSPWPTEYHLRTRRDRTRPRCWLNATIRDRLEEHLIGGVDEVTTLSEFMRDRLRERYDPDAPTAVVPGGVDVEQFAPDAGRYDPLAIDAPTFLTVRRLSPRMGHDRLLEAFSRVTASRPNAELFVAGDGPLRADLERRATTLGVDDRVTFLGYVPDADLPTAYATANVFVLPTTELEGFGLATLEALAAGTPVVGTTVGGTPELLADCEDRPEVPARQLTAPTADGLADRMLSWAACDDDALARAGAACRAYARENYTWESTVDAIERRTTRLLDDTTGRRAGTDAPVGR